MNFLQRLTLLLPLLALHICTHSVESMPAFPLWDNVESVESYAKRVNLPPTQTLDLGNGVKLELVLIPPGKFKMGTPEPLRFDSETYIKEGFVGTTLLVLSAGSLLALLILTLIRASREKRRPQVSLAWLVLMTALAGGTLLSVMHGRHIAKAYEEAVAEHAAGIAHYIAARPDEKPAHSVTLTKPIYMGKYLVTQEQYQAVMGANPSSFKGKDNPVEQVSFNDVQAFCYKLSGNTNQTFKLPTEAQWEYACRAGTTTVFYAGNLESDLERVSWHTGKCTHPVGQKSPNHFGLYDMHGNVWQWCEDWYGKDYYNNSAIENPQGPAIGDFHSVRGGAWSFSSYACRSANRSPGAPDNHVGSRDNHLGFRIVLVP